MKKNQEFYQIISRIDLGNKTLRDYFEESHDHYFGEAGAPTELSERKIKRDLVNSIRHNNSFDYDAGIREVHRLDRKNRADNYKLYKNIILDKIATKYPFLSAECRNQKLRVDMVKKVSK